MQKAPKIGDSVDLTGSERKSLPTHTGLGLLTRTFVQAHQGDPQGHRCRLASDPKDYTVTESCAKAKGGGPQARRELHRCPDGLELANKRQSDGSWFSMGERMCVCFYGCCGHHLILPISSEKCSFPPPTHPNQRPYPSLLIPIS